MKIQLVDRNLEMCEQWQLYFEGCNDVIIHHGDFFSLKTDCVVSPANSFGFMNGGLDYIISLKLGWSVQNKLQEVIREKYSGELLVGQAELVETGDNDIPFCISAPTMRVPSLISGTVNAYLACKAIFSILKKESRIETITISDMGTGVGKLPYDICAIQMREAYNDIWLSNIKFPESLRIEQSRHIFIGGL